MVLSQHTGSDLFRPSLDVEWVRNRLRLSPLSTSLSNPRPRFVDEPLWKLTRILADSVDSADPSTHLFGEGLIVAIAARLFLLHQEQRAHIKALAPWQLRRVMNYMQMHLKERITLAHLATLAGQSQWHFSRAFKAATGCAPYQWQLQARIRHAQALLLDTACSLEQVAESVGFADAAHFGKTFRKVVGSTPATWRRASLR